MIKTNELRIGNIVFLNDKQKVWEIMDGFDIDEMTENSSVDPIALTEKWLFDLGFNSQYKKGWIGIDVRHSNGTTTDFVLSYPQRMGMWQTFFAFEYDSFRFVELKYVHQLQNLYFALTGSELVFSTKP